MERLINQTTRGKGGEWRGKVCGGWLCGESKMYNEQNGCRRKVKREKNRRMAARLLLYKRKKILGIFY